MFAVPQEDNATVEWGFTLSARDGSISKSEKITIEQSITGFKVLEKTFFQMLGQKLDLRDIFTVATGQSSMR